MSDPDVQALIGYVQHKNGCGAKVQRMAGRCYAETMRGSSIVYCLLRAGHEGDHANGSNTWTQSALCTCGLSALLSLVHPNDSGARLPESGRGSSSADAVPSVPNGGDSGQLQALKVRANNLLAIQRADLSLWTEDDQCEAGDLLEKLLSLVEKSAPAFQGHPLASATESA